MTLAYALRALVCHLRGHDDFAGPWVTVCRRCWRYT